MIIPLLFEAKRVSFGESITIERVFLGSFTLSNKQPIKSYNTTTPNYADVVPDDKRRLNVCVFIQWPNVFSVTERLENFDELCFKLAENFHTTQPKQ
jgi:hypothetical protein